jgi:acyl carrier protein
MNIGAIIKRFLVDEIMVKDGRTEIQDNVSLIASGLLDSLALLRLIEFVEEQFGVTVEDDELLPENFQTIDAIRHFVEQKMQGKDG